jgi:hypothetical protein
MNNTDHLAVSGIAEDLLVNVWCPAFPFCSMDSCSEGSMRYRNQFHLWSNPMGALTSSLVDIMKGSGSQPRVEGRDAHKSRLILRRHLHMYRPVRPAFRRSHLWLDRDLSTASAKAAPLLVKGNC